MATLSFPNWSDALQAADLPLQERGRHRVIINWYLGYLKRESCPVTKTSARDFIEYLVEARHPQEWQLKQWTGGLNWFFREAPIRRNCAVASSVEPKGKSAKAEASADTSTAPKEEGLGDGRQQYTHTVAEMQAKVPMDPWYEETVRLMRVRQMAYRTEEAYLGWIRRMERFLQDKDGLEAFGEDDLKRFLSYLAVEEGVAAGTQRQALNAGVFFLREVRKMELGDFSDYVKANPRKYYPVVYSQGEISRLLAEVRDKWSILARLQYGCGFGYSRWRTYQKIHVGLRVSRSGAITFCHVPIRRSCRLPRRKRPFRSVQTHTFYGTVMRRTYSKMERIFEQCRSFLGILVSRRP
jgi:hypothetical protein